MGNCRLHLSLVKEQQHYALKKKNNIWGFAALGFQDLARVYRRNLGPAPCVPRQYYAMSMPSSSAATMAAAAQQGQRLCPQKCKAVVFDVLGTILEIGCVKQLLVQRGVPADCAELWMTRCQRDGMAATLAGGFAGMREVAAHHVQLLAMETGLPLSDDVAAEVAEGFGECALHPDVGPALRRFRDAGVVVATLGNTSHTVTVLALEKNGLGDIVPKDLHIQASDAHAWKPALAAYEHAATILQERHGVAAGEAVVVTGHAWDANGAAAAGMHAVYVSRQGQPYPNFFRFPDAVVPDLNAAADLLLGEEDGDGAPCPPAATKTDRAAADAAAADDTGGANVGVAGEPAPAAAMLARD